MTNEEKYFNRHWLDNDSQIAQEKLHVATEFLNPLIKHIQSKITDEGVTILDVGCGDGVHWSALSDFNLPVNYYGIDISEQVIEKLQSKFCGNACAVFSIGDAKNLNFMSSSFDSVFSFGVFGYTSDPKRCFDEMIRVTKPGGLVGIWLYPKKKGVMGLLFNFIRLISVKSHPIVKNFIANLIVPFLRILPTRSGLNLSNASWKQCREVVLVNIAPSHLEFFEYNDVRKWFLESGVKILDEDENNPITIWGIKSVEG